MKPLERNPFQERSLLLPEEVDAFLGGGRGGGKSHALALLALRHAEQYGPAARVLYIRRTYKGLADFELITRDLFGTVYGAAARYNSAEHVWRLPGGGYLELGQLESHADYAPSTFAGNQFIDREQYADQLRSSCPDDPELLRAWVDGDWTIARGAYFASVLDEGRNAVDPWKEVPRGWQTYLAHDFGSSAPSVTYVVAVSPGGTGPDGKFYPRDSLVLIDELATCKRDRPSEGLGWTVPILAEEIVAMCKRWKVHARGVADDAIFAQSGHSAGSIASEFSRCGVQFIPAQKADRLPLHLACLRVFLVNGPLPGARPKAGGGRRFQRPRSRRGCCPLWLPASRFPYEAGGDHWDLIARVRSSNTISLSPSFFTIFQLGKAYWLYLTLLFAVSKNFKTL